MARRLFPEYPHLVRTNKPLIRQIPDRRIKSQRATNHAFVERFHACGQAARHAKPAASAQPAGEARNIDEDQPPVGGSTLRKSSSEVSFGAAGDQTFGLTGFLILTEKGQAPKSAG